jgi:FeS assembly SUF system regulator
MIGTRKEAMFRIAKLTDYGIVLLTHFASHPDREALNARELSLETRLPFPTVGKLLKTLVHGELLVSHRGINGGYRLARRPSEINVAEIISILEGPIEITECNTPGTCGQEPCCPVQSNWRLINVAIREALEKVSLAEIAIPKHAHQWPPMPVSATSALPSAGATLPSAGRGSQELTRSAAR